MDIFTCMLKVDVDNASIQSHFGERSDPPFIFDSSLLGIPPLKKISSSSPLFNKNFLRGLSSLIYSKNHQVHVRVVQRGVWSHFYFVTLLEKVLIYPFLVQITHALLSLLGAKRSNSGGVWTSPLFLISSFGYPPLKTKIFYPPLSPFSGMSVLP